MTEQRMISIKFRIMLSILLNALFTIKIQQPKKPKIYHLSDLTYSIGTAQFPRREDLILFISFQSGSIGDDLPGPELIETSSSTCELLNKVSHLKLFRLIAKVSDFMKVSHVNLLRNLHFSFALQQDLN